MVSKAVNRKLEEKVCSQPLGFKASHGHWGIGGVRTRVEPAGTRRKSIYTESTECWMFPPDLSHLISQQLCKEDEIFCLHILLKHGTTICQALSLGMSQKSQSQKIIEPGREFWSFQRTNFPHFFIQLKAKTGNNYPVDSMWMQRASRNELDHTHRG